MPAAADLDPLLVHFGQVFRRQVDLEARLGVAEIVRAEARFRLWAQQRGEDIVEQRLKIPHGNIPVHVKTFELVEIGAVRRIGRVASERAAPGDTIRTGGRLLQQHGPDLHRRGCGWEEVFFSPSTPPGDVVETGGVEGK